MTPHAPPASGTALCTFTRSIPRPSSLLLLLHTLTHIHLSFCLCIPRKASFAVRHLSSPSFQVPTPNPCTHPTTLHPSRSPRTTSLFAQFALLCSAPSFPFLPTATRQETKQPPHPTFTQAFSTRSHLIHRSLRCRSQYPPQSHPTTYIHDPFPHTTRSSILSCAPKPTSQCSLVYAIHLRASLSVRRKPIQSQLFARPALCVHLQSVFNRLSLVALSAAQALPQPAAVLVCASDSCAAYLLCHIESRVSSPFSVLKSSRGGEGVCVFACVTRTSEAVNEIAGFKE